MHYIALSLSEEEMYNNKGYNINLFVTAFDTRIKFMKK